MARTTAAMMALASVAIAGCGATAHHRQRAAQPQHQDPQVRAYSEGYACGITLVGLTKRFLHSRSFLAACIKDAKKDGITSLKWDEVGIADGAYDTLGLPKQTARYRCIIGGSCTEDAALLLYWEHFLGG